MHPSATAAIAACPLRWMPQSESKKEFAPCLSSRKIDVRQLHARSWVS